MPLSVRGPVACCHGFWARHLAACAARRFSGQALLFVGFSELVISFVWIRGRGEIGERTETAFKQGFAPSYIHPPRDSTGVGHARGHARRIGALALNTQGQLQRSIVYRFFAVLRAILDRAAKHKGEQMVERQCLLLQPLVERQARLQRAFQRKAGVLKGIEKIGVRGWGVILGYDNSIGIYSLIVKVIINLL